MSVPQRALPVPSPEKGEFSLDNDLCVLVRCEEYVLGLPVQDLVRLVTMDEVREVGPGIVETGGALYASWDLGTMLNLSKQEQSWILCERQHGQHVVSLALKAGKCVAVLPIHKTTSFPSSILERRLRAFDAVFTLDASRAEFMGDRTGLRINLKDLWTPRELSSSQKRLQKAREAMGA